MLHRHLHTSGALPRFKDFYLTFRRINPTPIAAFDFISLLRMDKNPCVMTSVVSYAVRFLFFSVIVTVEIPQLFGETFHFNLQQLGLQFLGIIVGSTIGEQIGGHTSDLRMRRGTKKAMDGRQAPEFRL